ncbi:MAG: Holliday junction branch migration protein RuvA [Patescibacteria group bacterium]|nr:Holliday junction branch migration protein RuvA [Patescibacteria group bacterium]MDD3778041.1 Holliday junction branch migration protein RuvA [Patescibacteria group bacterium]MDD4443889.1 Holliday junction branch migration protein RuvA [Patescibacteria group bacterium]
MIAFLKGRVISKNNNSVVVLVQDIGYQVFCGENFLNNIKINLEQEFYIYHHVKEDASDLYGFQTSLDLEIFSLLLSVSGVGPKSALGVLSVSSAQDVSQAIMQGDPNLLTKVSGIGKKTAERIVLELKTKIGRLTLINDDFKNGDNNFSSDEIDALMSLGYSLSEARNALSGLPANLTDSGARVKAALQKMKKI